MSKPALSYCAEQVRRQDHDRYVTVLFAPADRREDLLALYAFNLEIAKTAEVVSEDLLGRMRLQWWRECLDEVYAGRPRRHAVVEPLAAAVRRHVLDRPCFERLIDAREDDLSAEPPADLAALESYAEGTSASLVHLGLQILGVPADSGAASAIDQFPAPSAVVVPSSVAPSKSATVAAASASPETTGVLSLVTPSPALAPLSALTPVIDA
jgi:phytoene synthase